ATNGVLLQKVAVQSPDTLVRLRSHGSDRISVSSSDYGPSGAFPDGSRIRATFSYPMFRTLRASTRALSDVLACAPSGRLNVTIGSTTDVATGLVASGNYFSMLGVTAARGRTLVADDDRPGASAVAVISDRFWQSRL